ncbi:MAG: MOP flippase family protein [Nostoc sp. ChiSLP02]|nr:MOP flippase family protein [Nostoc sp. DedSLP05]MDZ8099006.1 MOP flippase family protein [Nostoc sp. DedSLP01]MDZ8185818.1 MOP flippase family protein [Nostoc sp. ChiSLP02]
MEPPKQESSNIRQKALKGVFWSAIQNWGRQAIAFIVFALLARLLGPETFGLVASATIFLTFVGIFLDQGFSVAIVQRKELETEHLDTAFWTNLGIGLLMTIFGIAAAELVADFFSQPQLVPVIRWLSLSFVIISLSSTQEAIFQRNLDFKPLAVRELVAVCISGAVGVTMAFMGFGVWSLVSQQLVNGLVKVLVLWSASDWRPRFKFSQKHFKDLFSFGINVVGTQILNFINRRSDDLLISYFLGPVALGYYSVAYRLLIIMTQLLTGVTNQVAMPAFSRLQQEPEKLKNAFYKVTQLTSLISFPAFLGMAALAPELVRVLFGDQWLPSIPVMQVLAFIGIVHSVTYFNSTVITAMGKPEWKLKLNLMHSVANVVGFAIAVHWGIVAVAAVYVIRSYLLTPVDLWFIRKLIGIKLITYLRQYLIPLGGVLGMTIVIFAIKEFLKDLINIQTLLGICILFGGITYTVIIILLAPKIVQQILDIINPLISKRLGQSKR